MLQYYLKLQLRRSVFIDEHRAFSKGLLLSFLCRDLEREHYGQDRCESRGWVLLRLWALSDPGRGKREVSVETGAAQESRQRQRDAQFKVMSDTDLHRKLPLLSSAYEIET